VERVGRGRSAIDELAQANTSISVAMPADAWIRVRTHRELLIPILWQESLLLSTRIISGTYSFPQTAFVELD
jgi:hypothetical protein